jgi:phenylalanyl-tRNA synthetase beta chain
MKVSLNWLREYVELPESIDQLTEVLTLAGVEVENVEVRGVSQDSVVVAQILASERHPNADRLSVCKVDDGSGKLRQIVCGAKNYSVGDKVPLALPGAVLPGNFTIRVGKLRGVESAGMLCSAKELELADDADGLLILSPDADLGAPMSRLFPPDTILDLEITPNRPDLLSHLGMAREVATLLGRPRIETRTVGSESAPRGDRVTLGAGDGCPFYTVRRLTGVKVKPSPDWLCRKLEAVGVRPINNVVDITNFVMLEMGQPLHAFDAEKLNGGLQVKMASAGEEFLALDGVTYALRAQDVVVADSLRSVAIAGVMGGEESGVSESTTEILLESAYFKPSSVRRTARDLQLMSDSSYRFERGVDPAGVRAGSQRAAELLRDLAHATEISYSEAGAPPGFARTVPLRENRCSEVLGVQVPFDRVDNILSGFGLEKTPEGWNIPSFRQDLTREIDLVEEVARVFGIDRVPSREMGRFVETTEADRLHDRNIRLLHALVGQGFFEVKTGSLISEPAAASSPFAKDSVQRVKNPLVEDQVVLRPSLLPGLLEVVANNIRTGSRNLRLFEIGRVFRASEPEEQAQLAIVMTGEHTARSWNSRETGELSIFHLKGAIAALGLGRLEFEPLKNGWHDILLSLSIRLAGCEVGRAGQLSPNRARDLDATSPVLVAEIDLSAFGPAVTSRKTFAGISRFPSVSRDIAMLVPLDLAHGKVAAVLAGANEPLLEDVMLFDVFTDPSGQKIDASRKSMAYSLTYRASDRTLTSNEVNAAHDRLKALLKAKLPVELRE